MRGRPLLLILIGAAVLVVSSVLFYQQREGIGLFPNRTTYSAGPSGYKALYLTIEEIGYPPVGRWRKPLFEFTRPEDVMVIISPQPGQYIDARERDVIEEWVQDGGRLILLGHWFPVDPGFGGLLDVFDLTIDEGEGLLGSPFGLVTAVTSEIAPAQPTAYVRGVQQVVGTSSFRLTASRSDHVVHLADERGNLCISLRYGKGKVIAVADGDLGANQRIDRAANLRFLLNLLIHEMGAGTVWFDEYHHGFKEAVGFLAYVGRSRVAPVVFQLVIVAVVWLLASTRRFGPLRPVPAGERKRMAEHVDCLAELYAATEARSYAIREIYRKFRTDAARLSGLPSSAETAQVAMTYAHKFGYNADELRRVMLRCEQQWDEVSSRELFRLVQSLEQFAPARRR